MVREVLLEIFRDGCYGDHLGCYGDHLGNQNIMILASQNLHVSLMHPTKFQNVRPGPEVIKLFMLNITEHEIMTAHTN